MDSTASPDLRLITLVQDAPFARGTEKTSTTSLAPFPMVTRTRNVRRTPK